MPIRSASRADLAILVDLMARFYRESSYRLQRQCARAAFDQLLTDPSLGRVWICEQKAEAVGYIVLTLGFSMEYGGRDGFVDDLFILPQFRGKQLGHQLLDTLIRECDRLGVRALHLEVGPANQRAVSLYRARGFAGSDRRLLTLKLASAVHQPDRPRAATGVGSAQTDPQAAEEREGE